ncbi:hypothetical protein [Subtercola sp. YIM 133946]|uniref:hypothetical protein n=1 Tax=Subtercola sp. YIM 133946 TaxID=3118909 RepID=UPI002F95EAE8
MSSGPGWVADQYDVIAQGDTQTAYGRTDGNYPAENDADDLASNLNYSVCETIAEDGGYIICW